MKRFDFVDVTLRDALVIIDPMQNPDGRQRFVTTNLLGRAVEPDPNPQSAEHDEPWPGGRSNHYLVDMNRDYFAMSQPETQGRIRTMLEWAPQVVVDLHEMGGNSTYYFAPPADPFNPLITEGQRKSLEMFGRANAQEFDRRGFPYFVREVYDAFYPGYGDSWPSFQGAVAMTYEQASPRGLVFRREDGTLLTYKHAVTQHFTAAVMTAAAATPHRVVIMGHRPPELAEPELDGGLVGHEDGHGEDERGEDRGQGDDPGEDHRHAPDDERDQHRPRREGEEYSRAGGDPLPAAERDPDGEDVADDGRGTVSEGPARGGAVPEGEPDGGKPALEDIEDHDGEGGLPAQDAEGVGGAQVAAPVLPEVDPADEAGHDIAGGRRAQEVRGEEEDPAHFSSSRRPRTLKRSGVPWNPHAARNPL